MTARDPSSEFESQPDPAAENDVAEKAERQQLLDQVLLETLQVTSSETALTADELRPLLALARLRKGEPLGAETFRELVQTVLRLRFRSLVTSSSLWDKLTRQIAQAIVDDPRTQERVQQFWARLCEAAQ